MWARGCGNNLGDLHDASTLLARPDIPRPHEEAARFPPGGFKVLRVGRVDGYEGSSRTQDYTPVGPRAPGTVESMVKEPVEAEMRLRAMTPG